MASLFIHKLADVQSASVDSGTQIWQFVVILPGAQIGRDCNICAHSFVENDVILGDRVTIKCGVHLWDGLRVEDDVFIGPGACFANDIFPRSKIKPPKFLGTTIKMGASIGAGAVILPGLVIGTNAMVGAGSVVTSSVPPNAIVVGNPAKIIGYIDAKPQSVTESLPSNLPLGPTSTRVKGVDLYRIQCIPDIRGNLTVGEFERSIPFASKRYFLVYDVPTAETRGEHAHRECHQFLICIRGSCAVVVDDGIVRQEFTLNRPDLGMHIPPMVWGIQYKYSQDAALLVFASHYYESEDYIRDYSEFLQLKTSGVQ